MLFDSVLRNLHWMNAFAISSIETFLRWTLRVRSSSWSPIYWLKGWVGGVAGRLYRGARHRRGPTRSLRPHAAAPGGASRSLIGRRHPRRPRCWRHSQGEFINYSQRLEAVYPFTRLKHSINLPNLNVNLLFVHCRVTLKRIPSLEIANACVVYENISSLSSLSLGCFQRGLLQIRKFRWRNSSQYGSWSIYTPVDDTHDTLGYRHMKHLYANFVDISEACHLENKKIIC